MTVGTEPAAALLEISSEDRYLFERLARVDPSFAVSRQFTFEQLDGLLSAIPSAQLAAVEDALAVHLRNYKRSVAALYLSGALALRRGDTEGTVPFETLINLLFDRRQWSQLRDVCERVLRGNEEPLALRRLAAALEELNPEHPPVEIWQRLSLVDHEIPQILAKLARVHRERGDRAEAVACLRAASDQGRAMGYSEVLEEVWLSLLELEPTDTRLVDEIETYWLQRKKPDKAVFFLLLAVPGFLDAGRFADALDLVQRGARHAPGESELRRSVRQIFERRAALEGAPSAGPLDLLFAESGLAKGDVPVSKAIERLKQLTAFRVGDVVAHDSWGMGTIRAVDPQTVSIDFQKKAGHAMSLDLAENSLARLDRNAFKVRLALQPDQLRADAVSDLAGILAAVLAANNGHATASEIKKALMPAVVAESAWPAFWAGAKTVLEQDARFTRKMPRGGSFELRSDGIAGLPDAEQFHRLPGFEARFDWWMKNWPRIRREKGPDPRLAELLRGHFEGTSRGGEAGKGRQAAFALLVLSAVRGEAPAEFAWTPETFHRLHPLDALRFVGTWLKDADANRTAEMAARLLGHPHMRVTEWAWDLYAEATSEEAAWKLVEGRVNEYWRKPLAFVRLAQAALGRAGSRRDTILLEWSIPEKIEKTLSLDNIAPEWDERLTNVRVRQVLQDAMNLLSDFDLIRGFVALLPPERARIFLESYVQNEKVAAAVRRRVLHAAVAQRPELEPLKRFFDKRTKAPSAPAGETGILVVTQESYEQRSTELSNLLDKKRWADAAALSRAAAHGDLRENPEYQAARDEVAKTTQRLQELQSSLNRVRILQPSDVSTNAVSIGTRVRVQESGASRETTWTLLGPWEADEPNGILSYQAPLGRQLLGRKVGELVRVELPDGTAREFKVVSIEKAI